MQNQHLQSQHVIFVCLVQKRGRSGGKWKIEKKKKKKKKDAKDPLTALYIEL